MAILAGKRPRPYEIVALIGAGGGAPVAQPLLAVRRIQC